MLKSLLSLGLLAGLVRGNDDCTDVGCATEVQLCETIRSCAGVYTSRIKTGVCDVLQDDATECWLTMKDMPVDGQIEYSRFLKVWDCLARCYSVTEWTLSPDGGVCWDSPDQTCAVCKSGGCQCGTIQPTLCIECGGDHQSCHQPRTDTPDANCTNLEWPCNSGQCIGIGWECDGNTDCDDGTDEDSHCNELSTISGFVWYDTTGDVTPWTGIEHVQVILMVDSNQNGIVDNDYVEAHTFTTGPNLGEFEFNDVRANRHAPYYIYVPIDPASNPRIDGFIPTTPNPIFWSSGINETLTANFGFISAGEGGAISGIVQADGHAAGGVVVQLLIEETREEVDTQTTDNDGFYLFSGLPLGTYTIVLEPRGQEVLNGHVVLGRSEEAARLSPGSEYFNRGDFSTRYVEMCPKGNGRLNGTLERLFVGIPTVQQCCDLCVRDYHVVLNGDLPPCVAWTYGPFESQNGTVVQACWVFSTVDPRNDWTNDGYLSGRPHDGYGTDYVQFLTP